MGLRLPPLHCSYLGPYDFNRRFSWRRPSASLCTVARGPLSHTRAFLARPSPLQLNTVVGELFGLLWPTLQQQYVALRLWLGRDHPSNLSVVSPIYSRTWGSCLNCLLLRKDFEAVVRWCSSVSGILLLPSPAVALCGSARHRCCQG